MNFKTTKSLSIKQKEEIIQLWNNEYPKKINHANAKAFDDYLSNLTDQSHILLIDNDQIKAWFTDFIREDERWFGMILDSQLQGKGVGTELLNRAKEMRSELNGWVIDHNNDLKLNGENYKSPVEFYKKNGFEIESEVRLEMVSLSAVKMKWKKAL